MFDDVQSKRKPSKALKNQKPDIWEWLIKGTGSVAEPWPTVEEVLADPNVQKDIAEVQTAFHTYQSKKQAKASG